MLLGKKINVFEKIKAIEEQIKLELPHLNLNKTTYMFGSVSHFISGEIKNLNEDERALYDFMIRHKLNHKTTYNWFLLKNAPHELKIKINNGLWLRHALKEMAMYNHAKENPNDTSIIKDIQKYVRRYVYG